MKKIGIIHTTPATVQSLKQLVMDRIGDVEVINIMDDSILSDMRDNHEVDFVRERWIYYAGTLEKMGVAAVLSACSTVGEFAEEADQILKVPVYRIDEAMAEKAVEAGKVISVFATLNSTLEPTVRLVERKAREVEKEVTIHTILVKGAYEALMQGQKDVHDRMISESVSAYLEQSDVVVLAQASMASAIGGQTKDREKILTSPVLGIEKLKKSLEQR